MARKKKVTEDTNEPQPNIEFFGHRVNAGSKDLNPDEEGFVPREPLTKVNDGMEVYTLPSVEEQKAHPFYHPKAAQIVRLYPKLYKNSIGRRSK